MRILCELEVKVIAAFFVMHGSHVLCFEKRVSERVFHQRQGRLDQSENIKHQHQVNQCSFDVMFARLFHVLYVRDNSVLWI